MLKILLLLPVVSALVVAILPSRKVGLIRAVALAAALGTLGYALWLARDIHTAVPGVQLYETQGWNPRVGSSFSLGVDGVSFPMVLLSTLLTVVAVLASGGVRRGAKLYFLLLLLLEASMLGVFMARDWSLFYVFWELTLIPLFFLIDRLGGPNRHRAALNFVLYTMGGSVFMLVALLFMYDAAPGHSFGMEAMAEGARSLPKETQLLVFLGLFVGFGVKMPVFPLHGWLPLAHVEAPSPVSILLSGVLLKMGSYGLIRAAEALPGAVLGLQAPLAGLALASMVYGGVLAWRQRDLKAMVAYSSVSHMGVVLLGIAALNEAGLTGAVMQMVAHGLVAGALFLLVGLLYERTHTRDLADYGALRQDMPRFAFFIALSFVAAVGLPGTAGFIAELHALVGGYQRWNGWVAAMFLGMLISAAYGIRVVGRLCVGPLRLGGPTGADMRWPEMAAAGVLSLGTVGLGFWPDPALDLMGATVNQLARLF